jgi:hypothetical protein
MSDGPTKNSLDDVTVSFVTEVNQASNEVATLYEEWGKKLTNQGQRLRKTGIIALELAQEHSSLGKTLSNENYKSYTVSGPTLNTSVAINDVELIEKLLRARLEALQIGIAAKLQIFDDWGEVLDMFTKHFRADVEARFGEGGAKDLS